MIPPLGPRMSRARPFLPLLAVAITAIGIAYIHSASWDGRAGAYKPFAATQVKWLAIALGAFFATLAIPYPRIERHAYVLYGFALCLLAGLPLFGAYANGARAWYQWGSVKLQPSELTKLALIASVAKLLMYRRDLETWRGFAAPFVLAGPAIGLILAQPDLGTTMVFLPTLFAMLFVAGARPRHIAAVFAAGAALAPLAYHFVLRGHARQRIDVYLDILRGQILKDADGAGYQAFRSLVGIGSGGLSGFGWGRGPQTQLHLLPDNHTDFIFAVIGEEGGFVVAATVLLLELLLVIGCLEVAWRTREPFGRLVATGVAALFAGQVLVNAGMTVGLVPITGITLPFVSYGGSSLLTCFVALGLVVNVGMEKVPELGGR